MQAMQARQMLLCAESGCHAGICYFVTTQNQKVKARVAQAPKETYPRMSMERARMKASARQGEPISRMNELLVFHAKLYMIHLSSLSRPWSFIYIYSYIYKSTRN